MPPTDPRPPPPWRGGEWSHRLPDTSGYYWGWPGRTADPVVVYVDATSDIPYVDEASWRASGDTLRGWMWCPVVPHPPLRLRP